MRTHALTWPELFLIAGTRAMLGAGVGLLVAPRLSPARRRTLGYSLLSAGLLSTVPILLHLRRTSPHLASPQPQAPSEPVLGL